MFAALKFIIVLIVAIVIAAGFIYIGSFVIMGLLGFGAVMLILGIAALIISAVYSLWKSDPPYEPTKWEKGER